MFDVGMPELIVIFIIALLVFGPKKLPELGKSLGKAIAEFKRSSQEFRDHLESEVETDKIKQELVRQQNEIKESLDPARKTAAESKPEAEATPKNYAG